MTDRMSRRRRPRWLVALAMLLGGCFAQVQDLPPRLHHSSRGSPKQRQGSQTQIIATDLKRRTVKPQIESQDHKTAVVLVQFRPPPLTCETLKGA